MKKILIGSPIKQKSNILKEFLLSLAELNTRNLEIHYYFVDDNVEVASSDCLNEFKVENDNVIIKKSTDILNKKNEIYECNTDTHMWKKSLIERIITFKNLIIDFANDNNFDYLFFIDSDIVLNPETLQHLISRNVDIVSNVFWTSWKLGTTLLPQVWLQDDSKSYIADWDNPLTSDEKWQKTKNFVNKLKIPGLYKVGGLGACTVINKKSIQAGISFSLIDNLSFWGEDRHFCIRARVLGLELFVDTVYPAYHIYREEYLSGVENYKNNGFDPNQYKNNPLNNNRINDIIKNIKENRKSKTVSLKSKYKKLRRALFANKRIINEEHSLTVSMIVHNEEKRYLREVLLDASKYADNFVIIDDASTDNTVQLCKEVLKDKNYRIIHNKTSMFSNEYKLRKKQWNETIKNNPDWILFLDADEILENKFKKTKKYLMENNDVDLYCFRVFDMWNKKEYREDNLWVNNTYHRFLMRYQPKYKYKFNKKKQHCGRMPANVLDLQYVESDIRVKHYGWANEEDRKMKYKRYRKLDPDGKFGHKKQYESILDNKPNLIKFTEEKL